MRLNNTNSNCKFNFTKKPEKMPTGKPDKELKNEDSLSKSKRVKKPAGVDPKIFIIGFMGSGKPIGAAFGQQKKAFLFSIWIMKWRMHSK